MEPSTSADDAHERAALILAALASARKALRFYPRSNPQAQQCFRRLDDSLRASQDDAVLAVERDQFVVGGKRVTTVDGDVGRLAFTLHCLHVQELILKPALAGEEAIDFANLLNEPYETLRDLGPLDAALKNRGIHYAEVRLAPAKRAVEHGEGGERPPVPVEPVLHKPQRILGILADPAQFVREIVHLCVDVTPTPGHTKLEAQLALVDRFLQATNQAIESSPAADRPTHYAQLATAIETLVKSADVSGARMGGLPRVDMSHVDPKLREILPQRDLVKEVSSKVKLHQGATTVMTSALRELHLTATSPHRRPNPVLQVIANRRDAAESVITNMQVLEDRHAGEEVDGEYPGIKYAERDRNQSFHLPGNKLPAILSGEERELTKSLVDALPGWRPEVDSIETILDMLHNERGVNFFQMITDRLGEKLGQFLNRCELDPALTILRGLNVERRHRRDDSPCLARLNEALQHLESPETLTQLLKLAETIPIEAPAFEGIQSFLFLLDKRVVHKLVDLVAADRSRFSQRRILALIQFLCRNRLDLLAEGLSSNRQEVVRTVTWLLGRFGVTAIPHLRRAAHHPDSRVRREAIKSLAGVEGGDASRVLAAAIDDRDDAVASAALRAVIARASPEADATLQQTFVRDDWNARSEEFVLLLFRAAGRIGSAGTLTALRRAEERAGLRLKLTGAAIRDGMRAAMREIEERLARTP